MWCLMGVMALYGAVVVAGECRPFGIDEWRLIYNLKFKTAGELMGPLDFVQQFPRAYLQIIKFFSEAQDFSYFSLRLLPTLTGVSSMLLAWHLMNRLYAKSQLSRYLFVLILIGSPAFFEYFTEVKQYTMDILLSLVAVWQLTEMERVAKGNEARKMRYVLLCMSMAIAPFFSYTYSIVVAPLFVIGLLQAVVLWRARARGRIGALWLPLIFGATGIFLFYKLDAAQLMGDDKMHLYWRYKMMYEGFDIRLLAKALYQLFALGGSGLVFEIIIGGLSLAGIIIAMVGCRASIEKKQWTMEDYVVWYCSLLVMLVLVLYSLGKLPIGERRLNSFILTTTSLLVVLVIERARQWKKMQRRADGMALLLVVASAGSVVSAPVNEFMGEKHKLICRIYDNSLRAIKVATEKHLPIFITPGIGRPYEQIVNYPNTNIVATELCVLPGSSTNICADLGTLVPGDWILKAFPAYKVKEHLPVYAIADVKNIDSCKKQLPAGVLSLMVGDGVEFMEVRR